MTTSLNGVNFPLEPAACNRRKVLAGERVNMADGSLDYRPANAKGYRWAWDVQVDALTAANVTTISGAFDAAVLADVTWVPPEGGSYTVRGLAETWREMPDVQGGVLRFTVHFTLEEAS